MRGRRAARGFCRLLGHGQGCALSREVRQNAVTRAAEKREAAREIAAQRAER